MPIQRIAPETVARLAKLARLGLSEKESEKIGHDLGTILKHFEELKKIDTEGITPMIGAADAKNMMRSDDEDLETPEGGGLLRERILEAFPDRAGDSLKVQKIL